MPSRYLRRDVGARHADVTLHRLADELRIARAIAGLSLRDVAAAAGVSRSQLARLESGRAPEESLRTLSVVFAVLGMRLSARPYPEGTPIRDAAHARLLARFREELPPNIRLRTEVPLRQRPDLRTWDAELETNLVRCKLEADTVLYDVQAQERRIAQKMADDSADCVIWLVSDTLRNRRVLREVRELLAVRFPLDTRQIMRLLRAGRLPAEGGIVLR
jgi:transcriptional regulator with XRE-family HTH domain